MVSKKIAASYMNYQMQIAAINKVVKLVFQNTNATAALGIIHKHHVNSLW